jgi:hypothetical protein
MIFGWINETSLVQSGNVAVMFSSISSVICCQKCPPQTMIGDWP